MCEPRTQPSFVRLSQNARGLRPGVSIRLDNTEGLVGLQQFFHARSLRGFKNAFQLIYDVYQYQLKLKRHQMGKKVPIKIR